jgi:D-alanyl-D-alanine carboxypeptidase (penicillin-binding protein 5/6)
MRMNSRRFFLLLLCLLTPIMVFAKPDENLSSTAQMYILGDLSSGIIISEKNASRTIAPGPLTKLMTLYVIFSALESGDIRLNDKIKISKIASNAPGLRMFLSEGDRVKVEDLIKAIVIYGANDAIMALIEEVSGAEAEFVATMNNKAKSIGLTTSRFDDAIGQAVNNRSTTVSDLYQLSAAIITDFPQYYPYFKLQKHEWQSITQYSPNTLLDRDPHNDGLILGKIHGIGLLGSISSDRNGRRILVVLGGVKPDRTFSAEAQSLINHGFEASETILLFKSNTPLAQVAIAQGINEIISIGSFKDIFVTIPRDTKESLKVHVESIQPLIAPIEYGDIVAKLIVRLGEGTILTTDLIALKEVQQAGILARGWKGLKSFVLQLIGS